MDKEPRVAARYAQHFHVSPAAFKTYLENNVRLTTLRKPTQVTEYFTKKGGGIGSDKRVLPAGTKVFVTTSGELLMEWRCGNPLAARLPAVVQPKPAPKADVKPVQQTQVVQTPVVPVEPTDVTPTPPDTNVLGTVETLPAATAPIVPTTVPPAVVATATPVVAAPPVIASSGSSRLPWLIPLLIGAGAGLSSGGGGTETPEPATLLLLSSGVAAFGFKLRKIKR
jgi:hypothetical protein